MIQKRRERFRQEIRRKQLDCIIREARLKLIESPNFASYIQSSSFQTHQDRISAILQSLSSSIIHQQSLQIDSLFKELIGLLEAEQELASACLVMMAERMGHLLGRVIKNKTVMAEGSKEWTQIEPSLQIGVIHGFLGVFSMMSFREVSVQCFTALAESFWPLFYFQSIDLSQHPGLLLQLLKAIKQMLQSHSKIVASTFQSLNFSYQLAEIIKRITSLSKQCVIELTDILHLHLSQESQLQSGENRCEINGIDILGMENAECAVFAAFSMKVVRKKIDQALLATLNTLIIIFGKHPHLTSQVDSKFVKDLTHLIKKSPEIRIKKRVLELLCDLLSIQTDIGDSLLQNNQYTDILLGFLEEYSKEVDRDAQDCSYIVGCIISNFTLTQNKPGKQLLLRHPIWKFALDHCSHPSSPFFPLIAIFEYFFYLANEKETLEMLEHYLYILSCFELKMAKERESKAVHRTIMRVYDKAANSPEKDVLQRVKRLFQQYNMLPLLEQQSLQAMEEEELSLPVSL